MLNFCKVATMEKHIRVAYIMPFIHISRKYLFKSLIKQKTMTSLSVLCHLLEYIFTCLWSCIISKYSDYNMKLRIYQISPFQYHGLWLQVSFHLELQYQSEYTCFHNWGQHLVSSFLHHHLPHISFEAE